MKFSFAFIASLTLAAATDTGLTPQLQPPTIPPVAVAAHPSNQAIVQQLTQLPTQQPTQPSVQTQPPSQNSTTAPPAAKNDTKSDSVARPVETQAAVTQMPLVKLKRNASSSSGSSDSFGKYRSSSRTTSAPSSHLTSDAISRTIGVVATSAVMVFALVL